MTVQQLLQEKRYGAVYILTRYFYRIGEPVISDEFYDKLENFLRGSHYEKFKEYLDRTYDEDPIPFDLLSVIGCEPVSVVSFNEERSSLYNYLNEDKSFSIRSVTDYDSTFPFFREAKEQKQDLCISLKVDGVNTKMLYVNDKFALSLSRGRDEGNSFDYTDNSALIMPPVFKTGNEQVNVVGESFGLDEGLLHLRKKYNKPDGYVSGKSSAISLLRVRHELEDYKFLKTAVFSASVGSTLTESFQILEQSGFLVVPHFLIHWEEIPDDFQEFKVWAKEYVFDRMWDLHGGFPSDGVVAEVNDLRWVGKQHNQYVSRQLALKFEQWSYKLYKGIIKNIRIEQRRVRCSVRVEIEPLVTSDGNTARIINVFNPSILIKNNLHEGMSVYFERNSNSFNNVIYGENLEKLFEGEASD